METRSRHNQIAFRYLYAFRRTIPPLALVGGGVAWLLDWQALAAGLACISLGELLETSYYLSVLRWSERQRPHTRSPDGPCSAPLRLTG